MGTALEIPCATVVFVTFTPMALPICLMIGYQKVLVSAFCGSFFSVVFAICVERTRTPDTAPDTPNITPQYKINWFLTRSSSSWSSVHRSDAPYK